jgi:low temperature requirement protein LtrA
VVADVVRDTKTAVSPSTVLRDRSADTAPRVTSMELFFDLAYVFAVTQLSEHLGDT